MKTLILCLPLPTDGPVQWFDALSIPIQCLPHFSTSPLRWLRYLGFALTGSEGVIALTKEQQSGVTDYDGSVASAEPPMRYYFFPSRKVFPVDPEIESNVSSTHLDDCGDFRDQLMARDGGCVAIGSDCNKESCEAAHLIRFSKGGQYIQTLTENRRYGDEPIVTDINDIRNGLFVNMYMHRTLGKSVAFLQTPNFALELKHLGTTDGLESAPHFIVHNFLSEIDALSTVCIPHSKCLKLSSNGLSEWPPLVIFATLYGSAAFNTWGLSACMAHISSHWKNIFYSNEVTAGDGGAGDLLRERDENAHTLHERNRDSSDRFRNRGDFKRPAGAAEDEGDDWLDVILMYQELLRSQDLQGDIPPPPKKPWEERVESWLERGE